MNHPINDRGSAFPVTELHADENGHVKRVSVNHGMSLRDWFAGMALQGVIACEASGTFTENSITFTEQAEDCYRLADAMLAARERKEDA